MFSLIRTNLFMLVALAVAGCANTGAQRTQASIADTLSRPKTVLVYDFAFSPDVVVTDREFSARLERQIGDLSISKDLAAKRVNDEIVVTIATILRDEAGLNAQPGSEESSAIKSGALVIAGQLHAVGQGNRPQRRPVNFGTGGGVVADITVSQVSEGVEKRLLAFTAQAQNGRQHRAAITGPAAAARNAAIVAALGAKSALAVKLSPNLEAQARELARAIADKIIAYALQQGWVNKADLPEPPTDAQPTKKRLEKLPAAAAKQEGSPLPPDTIPCQAFTKNDRGNWYVKGPKKAKLCKI
jgi:hypothetical protein